MDDETVAEITDGLWSGQYEDEDSIILNVEEEGVAENPVTVLSPNLLNAVIEYNALNEDANLGITLVTNNYTWYVTNILDAAPVDLGVTFDTTNTPEETIDEVAEGNDYITFSIAHNGEFGFDAVVEFTIDEAYAGKTVALYWDNNGELELVSEKAVVNEDGTISFAMEHASDYVIVVEGTAPVVEDPVKPVPPTGDTTNVALWIALLGLGVVAIAGSVVMKKREF